MELPVGSNPLQPAEPPDGYKTMHDYVMANGGTVEEYLDWIKREAAKIESALTEG